MKIRLALFAAAAALAVFAASPVLAGASARAAFNANDRHVLNDYLTDLPSGVRAMAENEAGYRVGEILPHNAATSQLPRDVAGRLSSAPGGYSYLQAGTNIYLVSDSDRRIVDRVGLR